MPNLVMLRSANASVIVQVLVPRLPLVIGSPPFPVLSGDSPSSSCANMSSPKPLCILATNFFLIRYYCNYLTSSRSLQLVPIFKTRLKIKFEVNEKDKYAMKIRTTF
jgi:hypothetical protein